MAETDSSLANLLSPAVQQVIKNALQDVVDTFFRKPVTLNLKTTVPDKYGENPIVTVVNRDFDVLIDFSVGKSGRYEDVHKTDMGQRDEDSFTVYFWADDIINSGIVVDPENTTVTIEGIPSVADGTYEVRMFAPTAQFDDLGFVLYKMELKIYGS